MSRRRWKSSSTRSMAILAQGLSRPPWYRRSPSVGPLVRWVARDVGLMAVRRRHEIEGSQHSTEFVETRQRCARMAHPPPRRAPVHAYSPSVWLLPPVVILAVAALIAHLQRHDVDLGHQRRLQRAAYASDYGAHTQSSTRNRFSPTLSASSPASSAAHGKGAGVWGAMPAARQLASASQQMLPHHALESFGEGVRYRNRPWAVG